MFVIVYLSVCILFAALMAYTSEKSALLTWLEFVLLIVTLGTLFYYFE